MLSRFFRFFEYLTPAIIRETIRRVGEQRLPSLASEMAYSEFLALFPALLAIFTAIGLFEPLKSNFEQMIARLDEVVPPDAFYLIQNFSNEVGRERNTSLFSVSFLLAIWVSSSALSAAMRAMDHIHQIPPRETRPYWKSKLIAIGLTIAAILLLMLASFLVFISDALFDVLLDHMTEQQDWLGRAILNFFQSITWPFVLVVVSIVFACIYRYGPSKPSPGKPIVPGAILAAIAWAVISALFRFYVLHFGNYNRVYGVVGAVIILLLWLYISSLVMLIGDQLNVVVGEAIQREIRTKRRQLKGRRR